MYEMSDNKIELELLVEEQMKGNDDYEWWSRKDEFGGEFRRRGHIIGYECHAFLRLVMFVISCNILSHNFIRD